MAIKPKGYGGATIGPGAMVPKSVYTKPKPVTGGTIGPGAMVPKSVYAGGSAPFPGGATIGPGAPVPKSVYTPPLVPTPQTTPQQATDAQAANPFNYGAYLAEIQNDPVYMAALGNLNTSSQNWRRQLQSAIAGAVTQGGWDIRGALEGDPSLQAYAGDVTPEVAAAAAANQLSSRAQLEKQFNQQLAANAYAQAARGTLGSGSQAVAATNITDENVIAQNKARQELLDSLRGNVGSYLGNVAAGQQALDVTRGEVAARLAALEGATYGVGTQPIENAEDQGIIDETGTDTGVPNAVGTVGVQWGGRTFTTKAELASWLKSQGKGVTYAQWAQNHQQAAKRLR